MEKIVPLEAEVKLSIYGIPNMAAKTIEEIAEWLEDQACHLRMNRQEDYSELFKTKFFK